MDLKQKLEQVVKDKNTAFNLFQQLSGQESLLYKLILEENQAKADKVEEENIDKKD